MSGTRVTVSGTFRRAMSEIQDAVAELIDLGAEVLSPADPPSSTHSVASFTWPAIDSARSGQSKAGI